MSEIDYHLSQEIEELKNNPAEGYGQKAEQVISELRQGREKIYLDIFYRANQLSLNKKLKPRQFNDIYKKLSSTYRQETKLSLELLILDKEVNLTEQYNREKQILEDSGLIKPISTGELGIVSYDETETPLPPLERLAESIPIEKILEIQKKKSQGFTRLLITPFGMSLRDLISSYQRIVSQFQKEDKVFSSKGNPLRLKVYPNDLVKMSIGGPYMSGESQKFFSYYPSISRAAFNPSLMPLSKPKNFYNLFNIMLVEDLDETILPNKGEVISGRKQLEGGRTPYAYFANLADKQYRGEIGFTLEDWLALAISKLHSENILINTETSTMCPGTFLPMTISFPLAFSDDQLGTSLNSQPRDSKYYNSSPRMGVGLLK